MKYISLFLLLLAPAASWASYVQVCPDIAGCSSSEMVWMQIEPFGAALDPYVTSIVVGGGLLLWGVGCGIGMLLNVIRKFR